MPVKGFRTAAVGVMATTAILASGLVASTNAAAAQGSNAVQVAVCAQRPAQVSVWLRGKDQNGKTVKEIKHPIRMKDHRQVKVELGPNQGYHRRHSTECVLVENWWWSEVIARFVAPPGQFTTPLTDASSRGAGDTFLYLEYLDNDISG